MGRYQIRVKFKMNTMDKDYSGTLPTDGLGSDNTMDNKDKDNPRLWWAGGAGCANYTLISSDMTNAFNQITQAAILETVTSQFGLGVHANVLGVL